MMDRGFGWLLFEFLDKLEVVVLGYRDILQRCASRSKGGNQISLLYQWKPKIPEDTPSPDLQLWHNIGK